METYYDFERSATTSDPRAHLPAMLLQPLDDEHKEYELLGDTGRVAIIHMDDQRLNDRFEVEVDIGSEHYHQHADPDGSGKIHLDVEKNEVFSAEEQGVLRPTLCIDHRDHHYRLQCGLMSRKFVLKEESNQKLGTIAPEFFFSSSYLVQLPESLPLLLRVFMTTLVLGETEELRAPLETMPYYFHG